MAEEPQRHFIIESLGLFGSYVRNGQQKDSDLDFFVSFIDGSFF